MVYAFGPHDQIEEIDLTDDTALRRPQNQNPHSNTQHCAQNCPRSQKNKTTICHLNGDNSSRAMDQLSAPIDSEDRTRYSNRDDQANSEHAEQDSDPTADDIETYEDPDRVDEALESINKSLLGEDTATIDIYTHIDSAQQMLSSVIEKFPPIKPFGRRPKFMPPVPRESLHDLVNEMDELCERARSYLGSVEKSHQEAKQELDFLKRSVRSLLRAKTASAESEQSRKAADESMLDSIKFLKECLNDHARLVDIVLGRPEPLVKQGTELMQALLSEMFGLSRPDVQEYMQDSRPGAMEVSESEVEDENRLEIELASESESEVEYLWQTNQAEDLMNLEASEASGSGSDESDSDSISEGLDDLPDNMSEHSNYSTALSEIRDAKLDQKKRKKAREAIRAGMSRFASTVVKRSREERREIKRQKKSHNTSKESPENKHTNQEHPPVLEQPPVLKQTTIIFDKVQKSRRLFSSKELNQNAMLKDGEEQQGGGEAEEPADADVSPDSLRRNPRRRHVRDLNYNVDHVQPGHGWLFD